MMIFIVLNVVFQTLPCSSTVGCEMECASMCDEGKDRYIPQTYLQLIKTRYIYLPTYCQETESL